MIFPQIFHHFIIVVLEQHSHKAPMWERIEDEGAGSDNRKMINEEWHFLWFDCVGTWQVACWCCLPPFDCHLEPTLYSATFVASKVYWLSKAKLHACSQFFWTQTRGDVMFPGDIERLLIRIPHPARHLCSQHPMRNVSVMWHTCLCGHLQARKHCAYIQVYRVFRIKLISWLRLMSSFPSVFVSWSLSGIYCIV